MVAINIKDKNANKFLLRRSFLFEKKSIFRCQKENSFINLFDEIYEFRNQQSILTMYLFLIFFNELHNIPKAPCNSKKIVQENVHFKLQIIAISESAEFDKSFFEKYWKNANAGDYKNESTVRQLFFLKQLGIAALNKDSLDQV